MSDRYLVPFTEYGEGYYEEKRSKFIGQLFRVETPEQAIEKLEQVKKRYRDARHHCYAYIIREGNFMRYSDDGEPQGTAGMPMLDVLRREGVTNVCCVVTRYFGGILLGTGGLVRAYTKAAQAALAEAGIAEMSRFSVLLLACGYNQLTLVQNLLPEYDATADSMDYSADITLTVTVPEEKQEALCAELLDATAGTVAAEPMEIKFMGRRIR